jgi:hypothetical protein
MSDLESKKMLDIIHQNHKKQLNKKVEVIPAIDIMRIVKSLLIVLGIAVFIIVCINLTKQKNEAVNNCMKNHSKNYCERIAG